MSESKTKPSSTSSYPITNPPAGYMPVAKVCSFLVNVGSDMCQQWMQQGEPASPSFNWKPTDPCPYTSSYKLTDYTFSAPIWSTFTYKGKSYSEPFAFVATSSTANYLVFRGSQTTVDFDLDGEDPQVPKAEASSKPECRLKRKEWKLLANLQHVIGPFQAIEVVPLISAKEVVLASYSNR